MSAGRLWRRKRSTEADLDAELRFHTQRQYDDYIRAGLTPDDARRRVMLEFGSLELAKDECRDVQPGRWLATAIRDVRMGFRALRRERSFGISVTLILAVGIGTAVAMFSVVHGVVLRPLPYGRPAELAVLSTHTVLQNQFEGTSGANFHDWRRGAASFAGMTVYRRTSVSRVVFAGADAPQRAQEGLVGPDFFEIVAAAPLIGRTFSREEFAAGERVVVLSEGLWQEHFGRSAEILGRTLAVAGQDHTVIGVMPRSFKLPTPDTKLWRPLSVLGRWWEGAQRARDGDSFEVIGRLAQGARLEDAKTEMALIAARLRDAYSENRNLDIRVTSLADHVVDPRTQRGVWLGFGAVLCLLAIACANAGGLLAARAMNRRRELAVRAALGAERSRLVRQLLAETIGLSLVASLFGLLIAGGLLRLVVAYAPSGLPRMDEVGLDATAMAVAVIGGLAVVALCGSLPALLASKTEAAEAFRTREPSGSRRQGLHSAFVTAQISGAMVLIVSAALFAQSFVRVHAEDPGFQSEELLIARIDRPASPRFFLDARERLSRLPGIVAVGGITDFFIRRNADQQVTIEGKAFAAADGRLPRLVMDSVNPGYFRSMGIAVVDGRDFEDRDVEPNAPSLVIVNESMARMFWPAERAIGKRLAGGSSAPANGQWATVIGVVRDMRREALDVSPILSVFMPRLLQSMDLTIRTNGDADLLIPTIRHEIRTMDASLPLPSIISAATRFDDRLSSRRFETGVFLVFAVIAVPLVAIGLYALLAYQVTLRTREIAVRAALGAARSAIIRMFVWQGLRLALVGATIGLAGAVSAANLLQGFLYETAAINAWTYLGAVLLVLVAASAAAWRPARRAARVSPIAVLREG